MLCSSRLVSSELLASKLRWPSVHVYGGALYCKMPMNDETDGIMGPIIDWGLVKQSKSHEPSIGA